MPARHLPARPDLRQLKHQAKDLLRAVREAVSDAFYAAALDVAPPGDLAPYAAHAAELAAHGRLSPAGEAASQAAAFAEIVMPCARALLSRLRAPVRVPAAQYARIV